ncbi:small secreted protein [Fistulina hepatica ATCC 64428]|uniref:NADH dehydrogenase [ubiquinone] 1 alpha subcomplex subunit 1 n=1 Tax=Fistulina hepatica ATCC 64428 TaxID=1128425 RepID=A0A0D7ALI9_9AGAR|nr:small secreted protein [Fistulina hepatica ATCC 64428]
MPVPWEALLPCAILTAMFGVAGNLIHNSARFQNQGKNPRYNLDKWDEMMMTRDERLTGHPRGQATDPVAPPAFATNSVWTVERAS